MDFTNPSSPGTPVAAIPVSDESGKNIRIAQACIDGAARLKQSKKALAGKRTQTTVAPDTAQPRLKSLKQLSRQLYIVSAEIDTHRAALLELLVQFDDQSGWEAHGARNCAEWANAELGIARASAYEFLRVGRELRQLPIIAALFRGGELSWSKVRLLIRVADADNERDLAHVSLDATVEDVRRICNEFRWKKREQDSPDINDERSVEDIAAFEQFQNRSLIWREVADGSVEFRLTMPPEKAQAIIKSLEHCENELYEGSTADNQGISADKESVPTDKNAATEERLTVIQRRADAFELMAERSLAFAGEDVSRADRYQVIMHVDKNDIMLHGSAQGQSTIQNERFPSKRPWIEGAGPLAPAVARRLSCDAVLVGLLHDGGEPMSVGRKTRTWPTAIWRAVVSRDRHCQFDGCNEHKHLEVHHIKHWADGGETSVDNGICLCRRHHILVHEGGYQIRRNTVETTIQSEHDFGLTSGFVSSNKRALLPTRQRFRFIKPFTNPDMHPIADTVTDPVVGPAAEPIVAPLVNSALYSRNPAHDNCECKEASATYGAGLWRQRAPTRFTKPAEVSDLSVF